jgi:hypothetical protein
MILASARFTIDSKSEYLLQRYWFQHCALQLPVDFGGGLLSGADVAVGVVVAVAVEQSTVLVGLLCMSFSVMTLSSRF